MNDEKESNLGTVEQEIISMLGDAGNEIMGLTRKEVGIREDEIAQKIHIVNLSKCIIYLAQEIDRLAKTIKGVND